MCKFMGFILLMAVAGNAWAVEVDMGIIKQIEGGGCRSNASCVGDKGLALSYWQLHKGVVVDFNRVHKTSYSHGDVRDEAVAEKVARWYMSSRIPAMLKAKGMDTLENRLTAWNMGIGNAWKGKRATSYINKYRRLENAL